MHQQRRREIQQSDSLSRCGAASPEYLLIIVTSIFIIAAIMAVSKDLLQAAYELIAGWVSWPFL